MDIISFGKAISNPTRLELLRILNEDEGLSLDECYKQIIAYFNRMHKESVYRALETLVKTDLINKEYCTKRKKLVYKLKNSRFLLNVKTGKLQPLNRNSNNTDN